MGDNEQLIQAPQTVIYLACAAAADASPKFEMPDRCRLLTVSSFAQAMSALDGEAPLAVLFDQCVADAEWVALARQFSAPGAQAPVPLVCLAAELPAPGVLAQMEAMGVVDTVVGDESGAVIAHKMRGLVRMQRHAERAERQALDRVESEADLEIMVHQLRAANLQLRTEERQRRRAIAALAISEARFRSLMETSGDWVWEVDTDARYTYVSPNAEAYLGVPAAELTGRPMAECLPGGAATRVHRAFVELLRANKPFLRFDNPLVRPDGRPLMVETSIVPVVAADGGVIGFRGIDRDITLRKEQEAELEQARRAEAIGQLTGGITHDLNNLLTIVLGNLRLLGREVEGREEAAELIEATVSAAGEAVDLLRQLSGKTPRQPLQKDTVDLNVQVADTTRMLRRTLGPGIELLLELNVEKPIIAVDTARLHNALLNLALNARDAMDGKGRLMIETALAEIESDRAGEELKLAPGSYAVVRVMDTGCGMPPDVLRRATEPFFTTKESGKGSGMGLSMVFGLAVKAGGAFQLDSRPGEGTTASLWLPLQSALSSSAADSADIGLPDELSNEPLTPPAPVEDLPRGSETVLVADDDPRIRRLTVRFLAELGYRVLEVGDGSAAREVLEGTDGEGVELLFSDIVMPGELDGVSLAHWVREHRPTVRVLLSSGFGNDGDGHGMDTGDLPFLPKPFAQRALALAVRTVLDA